MLGWELLDRLIYSDLNNEYGQGYMVFEKIIKNFI